MHFQKQSRPDIQAIEIVLTVVFDVIVFILTISRTWVICREAKAAASSYAAAYAKGFCQTQDKTSREPLPPSVISNSGPTDFIHSTLIIGHTF